MVWSMEKRHQRKGRASHRAGGGQQGSPYAGRSLQLCPCGNTDSPTCPLPLLCSIVGGQQKWSALGSGSETFLESHEAELFLTRVGCSAEGWLGRRFSFKSEVSGAGRLCKTLEQTPGLGG